MQHEIRSRRRRHFSRFSQTNDFNMYLNKSGIIELCGIGSYLSKAYRDYQMQFVVEMRTVRLLRCEPIQDMLMK